jgi:hypothetical protein
MYNNAIFAGGLRNGINCFNAFPFYIASDPFIQLGDLILHYFDPLANWGVVIIVHCNNVAYGTLLQSFWSDLIIVNQLRLIVPIANINQLANPLIFGYQTLFGKVFTDSVDPRMYQTSQDFQNQICDIPLTFPIDKALFSCFNLSVFCQQMSIILFVQKVEPLTLRKK